MSAPIYTVTLKVDDRAGGGPLREYTVTDSSVHGIGPNIAEALHGASCFPLQDLAYAVNGTDPGRCVTDHPLLRRVRRAERRLKSAARAVIVAWHEWEKAEEAEFAARQSARESDA